MHSTAWLRTSITSAAQWARRLISKMSTSHASLARRTRLMTRLLGTDSSWIASTRSVFFWTIELSAALEGGRNLSLFLVEGHGRMSGWMVKPSMYRAAIRHHRRFGHNGSNFTWAYIKVLVIVVVTPGVMLDAQLSALNALRIPGKNNNPTQLKQCLCAYRSLSFTHDKQAKFFPNLMPTLACKSPPQKRESQPVHPSPRCLLLPPSCR